MTFNINRMMTVTGVFAGMAMAAPAFASHGGDMTNMSMIRHEISEPARLKLVRIEGALTCDMGSENRGEPCELQLHEAGTGKIYRLIQAQSALQLFHDGSKNVLIEGHLEGPETLQVKTAQETL